jgi:hypothetical protein
MHIHWQQHNYCHTHTHTHTHTLPVFPLQVAPVSLDVLDHSVLARKLIVVGEVVDDLVVCQPEPAVWVEYLPHAAHTGPVKVPVARVVHSHPLALLEVGQQCRLLKLRAHTDFRVGHWDGVCGHAPGVMLTHSFSNLA